MVREGEATCPVCGGTLTYYDSVLRAVLYGNRKTKRILIGRYICKPCGRIHRMLPPYLDPFKQYDNRIIKGFMEGQLSFFDTEYEDYPSESTIRYWQNH